MKIAVYAISKNEEQFVQRVRKTQFRLWMRTAKPMKCYRFVQSHYRLSKYQ